MALKLSGLSWGPFSNMIISQAIYMFWRPLTNSAVIRFFFKVMSFFSLMSPMCSFWQDGLTASCYMKFYSAVTEIDSCNSYNHHNNVYRNVLHSQLCDITTHRVMSTNNVIILYMSPFRGQRGPVVNADSTNAGNPGSIPSAGRKKGSLPPLPNRLDK